VRANLLVTAHIPQGAVAHGAAKGDEWAGAQRILAGKGGCAMSVAPNELLARSQVIAVVGMSTHPAKEAHAVPMQLVRHGWTVIPVNPNATEIGGLVAYPSLADVPVPVDLVNVFRPSEHAGAVVEQAIAIGAPAVWLQQGIVSTEGRAAAEAAGIDYVEDQCIAVIRSVYRVRPPEPVASA
jgi:predicted CoA-binding protein